MNTNELPLEVIVILCGIGLVALLWLVLRFGRTIARALLVGGILVIGVIAALALLSQGVANHQTAQAATEAAKAAKSANVGLSVGTVVAALCIGGLGTAAMGAMGVAGFLYWRLQMEQQRPQEQLPQRKQRRRALPQQEPPEMVYIVDGGDDKVDLTRVDLSQWGW